MATVVCCPIGSSSSYGLYKDPGSAMYQFALSAETAHGSLMDPGVYSHAIYSFVALQAAFALLCLSTCYTFSIIALMLMPLCILDCMCIVLTTCG